MINRKRLLTVMIHQPGLSRRDSIKGIAALVGSLIGITIGFPTIAYLLSPALRITEDNSIIGLGPLESYPIGIPTRFEFTQTKVNGWERTATSHGLYVIRTSEGEARVFSDICTHLGCRVTWHSDQQHYISPCHDGHFDAIGNVVSAPPPDPLDEYITKIENGNLVVMLPAFKRKG
jgi:menaquinol-cytochrome c reductase iron-sulfur subunit